MRVPHRSPARRAGQGRSVVEAAGCGILGVGRPRTAAPRAAPRSRNTRWTSGGPGARSRSMPRAVASPCTRISTPMPVESMKASAAEVDRQPLQRGILEQALERGLHRERGVHVEVAAQRGTRHRTPSRSVSMGVTGARDTPESAPPAPDHAWHPACEAAGAECACVVAVTRARTSRRRRGLFSVLRPVGDMAIDLGHGEHRRLRPRAAAWCSPSRPWWRSTSAPARSTRSGPRRS